MDLRGTAVIVTGSSSGIGEAIARRLAEAGAGIVVNSATSVEAGEALAADLPDAVYVQGEVGEPDTGHRLVHAALERWGRLDGLVNNAGRTVPVPQNDLEAVTADHWDTVMRTNVIGTYLVIQAALTPLRESPEGWILNIGSVAGVRQTGSSLPYAVSKAALHHMTTLLAKFVGDGVRVNALAPGLVDTPWTEEWDLQRQFVEGVTPLQRIGTPADIADAAFGIIGSRYTSGAILLVDGGLSIVI